ncbi:MAG TPA: efflux transporter outer membrane subunit [Dyella sp.]|uniref:efflux transporter outer membrane subunit n=1 Tax=Dyella sp. TaxID=1869338 RepID=UPI002CE7EDA3|nr:efflux transporter outer membrane subunit [Dyella sp.]HUB90156.1 efflux transporter outer membrane subunit [Dyella sp.]
MTRHALSSLLLALTLSACAAGPDFKRPAAPPNARYLPRNDLPIYTTAIGQTQHFRYGADVSATWWHALRSEAIDTLVSQAIAGNPDLQAAQASLQQAQHSLRAGQGIFFPQIGGNLDAARERSSPAGLGLPSAGGIFNLFTLGATVSYALDLFGGERRTVEGLRAGVDMQRYTLQGTYQTLIGNVVNTALARQAYADEITAMHQLISLQTQQLALVDARIRGGGEAYADLLSLRSARALNVAQLASLALKRDQADHLLHTLLGQTPGEARVPDIDLAALHLPATLPVSLPSDLVRQRPDILASEARLHQASANIGVATAALFPSISLSGDYGAEANTTGALDQRKSRFWSADGSVQQPIFQGGTRWFNRKAAIDAYQSSLQSYRSTVLAAFQQVADVLKALQHDAESLQANDEAQRDAAEALQLVQANYAAGLSNDVEVLVADAQYRQARIAYVQALAQRYQDTVALYVALGGGGWHVTEGAAAMTTARAAQRP